MPKYVKARTPQNEREERAVRKLARSHHAPADWIWHARMVVESWAGKTPDQIAAELQCHPQTVRMHVARFNQQGIEGLGVQPGSGRKPRLTEAERSIIVALPSQPPPGRLVTQRDGTMVVRDESGSAQWSLDALAQAAKEAGIRVKRSQIRRILLKEGVRWRQTHSWGTPRDFHLMGALAEFERDLIRERTNAGLAAARARGRVGGRPRKLSTNGKVALAQRLFADKKHAIDDICSTLGISRSTLYRYVREAAPPALDS